MYFGYVCFLVKDQKSKMVAIVEKNYNIEGVYRHNDGKKKEIIQMLEYRLNQNGA